MESIIRKEIAYTIPIWWNDDELRERELLRLPS